MQTRDELAAKELLSKIIRQFELNQPISIPVNVNFGPPVIDVFISGLSMFLIGKCPATVILCDWYKSKQPTDIHVGVLRSLFSMLAKAKVCTVILDLSHMEEFMIEDIYKKTKSIMGEMPIKPIIKCHTTSMYVSRNWNELFVKIILDPYTPRAGAAPGLASVSMFASKQPDILLQPSAPPATPEELAQDIASQSREPIIRLSSAPPPEFFITQPEEDLEFKKTPCSLL